MRKLLLAALLGLLATSALAQNYTATQGSGTTFGAKSVTSVLYPQIVFCDPTTPANCAVIDASGFISVKSTTLSTSANQATEIASLATIATNTGAAIPAGSNVIGFSSNDPCSQASKTNFAIASATGTTQLVAPSGSTQVYVCSMSLIAAAAAVVNLVGGTGAACTTGTPVAALGSTTAANGMSLAGNGGLTFGNGGATVVRTTTAGHGLCLIQSGTVALAGNITYVQQ